MKKLFLALLAFCLALVNPLTASAWNKGGGATCSLVNAFVDNDTAPSTTRDWTGYVRINGTTDVAGPTTSTVAFGDTAEISWVPTAGFVGTVEAYVEITGPSGSDSSSIGPVSLNCPVPPNPKGSSLGTKADCIDPYIQVTMDLKDNGVGVANVKVNFSYDFVNKEAYTNNDGRAQVAYLKAGNHSIYATPDGGYPAQSQYFLMPEDCPTPPSVSEPTPPSVSEPTPPAPALAATGIQEELTLAGQIALLLSGQVGVILLLKKKLFA